jgi:hypothetical protein
MQEPVKISTRWLRIATSLIVVLIVTAAGTYLWYSLYRPCKVETVQKVSTRLVTQVRLYDDAYQFATSASPDRLVRPVNTLQQILMDTKQMTVPACMQTAKDELINYMGTVIRAFSAYGAGEPDSAVRDLIEESATHYGNFNMELEEVNKCAPFCFP